MTLVSYEDTAAQCALRLVRVLWTASNCECRALSGLCTEAPIQACKPCSPVVESLLPERADLRSTFVWCHLFLTIAAGIFT